VTRRHEANVAETLPESLPALSLTEFLDRLASRAPTPGGGSASALAGTTAAALLHMVLELTAGRADVDEATLTELSAAATTGHSELLALVQADAAAYGAVVAARRLPRETDRDTEARHTQMMLATREAIRVPLEIVRRASAVLELAERIASFGVRSAISDVGVAALLAAAAMRGAALNVRVNLPFLPEDDPLRAEAGGELDRLLIDLDEREAAVHEAVEGRSR
jgi:formiminotetrahydrofolate cyclodeaminase